MIAQSLLLGNHGSALLARKRSRRVVIVNSESAAFVPSVAEIDRWVSFRDTISEQLYKMSGYTQEN